MFDDVRQASGVQCDHRGGADVSFKADVGQISLAREDQHGIDGAVKRAQVEVVVQVSDLVDDTITFSRHPAAGRYRPFAKTGRYADR